MLDIRELDTGYGNFQVLKQVSLSVPDGEVVALFGHNGAGKSTLLRAIFGQLPRWSGSVDYKERPHDVRDAAENARRGLRYVPQEGNTFPNLSVEDNLLLGVHALDPDALLLSQRLAAVYDLFPLLYERRGNPARVLSGGERQMLAVSLALMTAPDLLLLDEPSLGLAPVAVQRLFDSLARMQQEQGTTILLVEQNVNEALRLAKSVYVMHEGTIVFHGPSSERDEIIRHLWGLRH